MEVDIGKMTMEEYDIMIREGGRSWDRSIEEMTMEEYEEAILKRNSLGLDWMFSNSHLSLKEILQTPSSKLKNMVNIDFYEFTDISDEIVQEIMNESRFDAILLEDIASKTNHLAEIPYSLEEKEIFLDEELDILLADEIAEMKERVPKDPNDEFDPDKDLRELEYLIAHPGATLLGETDFGAENELEITPIRRMQHLNTSYSSPIRRMNLCNTPYSKFWEKFKISDLHESNGNVKELSEPRYSFIELGEIATHELLFAIFKDVCVHYFNPRHEAGLLRETRRWKDAWVKHFKVLVQSNEALFLDDYLQTAENR